MFPAGEYGREVWIKECDQRFGGIGIKRQAKSIAQAKVSDIKPINLRLQEKRTTNESVIKPRRYQEELFIKTLHENVIIYLGTGLGKTFITVLYLNSPPVDAQIRAGRKVVFLAPTQDLVKQQAEYVYTKVPYKVQAYCGQTAHLGTHIDHWRESVWAEQLLKVDILFMTPQIFCSAISTGMIRWKQFSTLIFDEVHHAATSKKEKSGKNSGGPYSQILEHYHTFCRNDDNVLKPRLIGLTASLINNMPKDVQSIRAGVHDLERKLVARCVTDITAIEYKPQLTVYKYAKSSLNRENDEIIATLTRCCRLFEDALAVAKARRISLLGPRDEHEKEVVCYLNRLRLASHGFSIKPGSFHKIIKQLIRIRANSGLWTFANICYNLLIALGRHVVSPFISSQIRDMYKEFASMLKFLVHMVKEFLGSNPSTYLLDYSQPKLLCLLNILRDEYIRTLSGADDKSTFSCLVFVKSRVEVFAVAGWLQRVSDLIPEYDFIKADYAIGLAATQTSKWACITKRKSAEQGAMLDNFRLGHLNVCVTTSVLEEGIDLPVCSTVIRYDTAETFRVYIQSRGRARQRESTFIAMCEESMESEARDRLVKFNDFDDQVKEILSQNNRTELVQSDSKGHRASEGFSRENDVFIDQERGIRVDSSLAKIMLNMYFQTLTRRTPFSDGPTYEREQTSDRLYVTSIFLPAGCPITDVICGDPRETVELADNSAIVAAYRELYTAGELDEHGVPIRMTEEHIDAILMKHGLAPNFDPLDDSLNGEVEERGGVCFHYYTWLFTDMRFSLAQGFAVRSYSLFRLSFLATDDLSCRKDARPDLEKRTLGIIVDAQRSQHSWPNLLYSHYGNYNVEVELLEENFKIRSYAEHQDLVNYTYRLATTFWALDRVRKDEFRERCLFYLVPLDSQDRIDQSAIKNAFFTPRVPRSLIPGDLVRLGRFYRKTPTDHTRSCVVQRVWNSMTIYSQIPEARRGETFLTRALARYGEIRVHDTQPIVEVMPIAQEVARSSQGKLVDPDQTTKSIYIPEQFLECYEGNVATAFQAYNLPEIIYKIYLTTFASDLENDFINSTAEARRSFIQRENYKDHESPWIESDDKSDEDDVRIDVDVEQPADGMDPDPDPDQEMNADELGADNDSLSEEEEENVHDDGYEHSSSHFTSDSSDEDEAEQAKPSDKYRLMNFRQKLSMNDRGDDRGMERWDMGEYRLSGNKPPEIQVKSFDCSQKYLLNSPRLSDPSTNTLQLVEDGATRLADALGRFRTGILGEADLEFSEQVFDRPGKVVDLRVEPPFRLDRNCPQSISIPPREMDFVLALTQKRSGERENLELLENIGDSFLKYCVSFVLYKRVDRNEGQLTYARSRLVSNKHFAHLAKKRKLGCYAIGRKFEMETLSSLLGGSKKLKNRLREKDLADMFESLVGTCLVYRGDFEAILMMKWLGLDIFDDDSFCEFHRDSVAFMKPRNESYIEKAGIDMINQSKKRLERFQDIICHKFVDMSYLVQAFTHASSPIRCTETYERLEFLGDAVLDYLITTLLFRSGRCQSPGQITSSRSALVNNCTFAKLAIQYKFDIFIQHANQELYNELNNVNECAESDPKLEFLDDFRFDQISKVLGDVFESVAGAIYLDSGCSLDAVFKVYYPMMQEIIEAELQNPTKNLLVQLYEKFAGPDRVKFEYFKVQSGPDAENYVTNAVCTIYKVGQFNGQGQSKRQARKRAAAEALANLPSEEDQKLLDEEYALIAREKLGAERGRFRGGRGNRSRGGRGRGASGQRGRGNQQRHHPYRAGGAGRQDWRA